MRRGRRTSMPKKKVSRTAPRTRHMSSTTKINVPSPIIEISQYGYQGSTNKIDRVVIGDDPEIIYMDVISVKVFESHVVIGKKDGNKRTTTLIPISDAVEVVIESRYMRNEEWRKEGVRELGAQCNHTCKYWTDGDGSEGPGGRDGCTLSTEDSEVCLRDDTLEYWEPRPGKEA